MSLIVLKLGGAVAAEVEAALAELAGDDVVVVHGGGPQITAELAAHGIESRFVNGRRVTDARSLVIVRAALAAVNREVCAAVGPRAVGLQGDRIGLRAKRVRNLGFVGDPLPSRPEPVLAALAEGLVPVVTPLAAGPLNVNADEAAAALAAGLEADRIVFSTNVPGVLRDGALVSWIGADEAEREIAAGAFAGGIVPKLEAAILAARLGVKAEIGETAVLA
jgi:acetylglutamate kinase